MRKFVTVVTPGRPVLMARLADSPGISPWPALSGLAGLKTRGPQAQSFAAGGAERNQDSERQDLPCRRVAEVPDCPGEIKAERPQYIQTTAGPKGNPLAKNPHKAPHPPAPPPPPGLGAQAPSH